MVDGLPKVPAGIDATVGGEQTVPRAELSAVCAILAYATQPFITIVVDATYILRGFFRGPRNISSYSNPDLWTIFWERIQKRGGATRR